MTIIPWVNCVPLSVITTPSEEVEDEFEDDNESFEIVNVLAVDIWLGETELKVGVCVSKIYSEDKLTQSEDKPMELKICILACTSSLYHSLSLLHWAFL